jgi:hypothetical protein
MSSIYKVQQGIPKSFIISLPFQRASLLLFELNFFLENNVSCSYCAVVRKSKRRSRTIINGTLAVTMQAANTVPPKPQHLQLTCAFNKRVAVVPRTLLFTLERFAARHVAETVASIRHQDGYKEHC